MNHTIESSLRFCLLSLTILVACSKNSGPPQITVEDVWSMPVIIEDVRDGDAARIQEELARSNGVAYLTIRNTGGTPDRLLALKTGVCDTAELHTVVLQGETMKMQPIADGLEIEAGEQVELKPRSHHVMLMGLKRSLAPGDSFALDLVFEKSGTLTVQSHVRMPR